MLKSKKKINIKRKFLYDKLNYTRVKCTNIINIGTNNIIIQLCNIYVFSIYLYR